MKMANDDEWWWSITMYAGFNSLKLKYYLGLKKTFVLFVEYILNIDKNIFILYGRILCNR